MLSGPKQDFSNTDGTQTLCAPHDTVNIPGSLSQRVIARTAISRWENVDCTNEKCFCYVKDMPLLLGKLS